MLLLKDRMFWKTLSAKNPSQKVQFALNFISEDAHIFMNQCFVEISGDIWRLSFWYSKSMVTGQKSKWRTEEPLSVLEITNEIDSWQHMPRWMSCWKVPACIEIHEER